MQYSYTFEEDFFKTICKRRLCWCSNNIGIVGEKNKYYNNYFRGLIRDFM